MPKLRIFLSHASGDKAFVRRFNNDVKSHGFSTWLDEDDIPYGGSIPDEIQNGLKTTDVVFVFLSERAVASKWVSTEWQSPFFSQVNDNKIQVIPVLLENCAIPLLLANKRSIDFRNKGDYEANLSSTLKFLAALNLDRYGEKVPSFNHEQGVLAHVQEILDDLDNESISLPVHRRLPIIGTLKKIPRSGKRVRLVKFQPALKLRSIFDHILSLAHISDCLLPHIEHKMRSAEIGDLSLCIAYHELNEVVLGDIPSYTSLDNDRRNMIRVYAEERLRNVAPDEREEIANRFIWMFLSEKHRQALTATMAIFKDKGSKVFSLFRALDKMDPIVAVWRYLHHYRGKLGENPSVFNSRMKDSPCTARPFKWASECSAATV